MAAAFSTAARAQVQDLHRARDGLTAEMHASRRGALAAAALRKSAGRAELRDAPVAMEAGRLCETILSTAPAAARRP